jgi:hypothetical protein
MSISLWRDRHRLGQGQSHHVDFVVVGAGIAGLSTCYWLERKFPDLSIALIEKDEIGAGASGRNAGFVTCGSVEHFNRLVQSRGLDLAKTLWRFGEENLSLLKTHIIENKGRNIGFEEQGSFSLASEESEYLELKKSAEIMKMAGINVDVLDRDEIKQRLNAEEFIGGIKYLDDASIDPISLLDLIRSHLKKTKLFMGEEVFEVKHSSESVRVKTQRHEFVCESVVLALNAYAPLLHNYFQNIIVPTRGQILTTSPVEPFLEGPCYAHFVLDYFRQLPSGEVIIGGFRQLQKDSEVGYSDQITPVIQQALEGFLEKHLPKLKGANITHRWSGVMGFSQDGWPIIGSLPGEERVFFLGGFTAHGIGLAFHSAKVLVEAMEGENIPKHFNARRFHK